MAGSVPNGETKNQYINRIKYAYRFEYNFLYRGLRWLGKEQHVLITSTPESRTKKILWAESNNIPILSHKEFEQLLKERAFTIENIEDSEKTNLIINRPETV